MNADGFVRRRTTASRTRPWARGVGRFASSLVALTLAGACRSQAPTDPEPIRVAAAADLTLAFAELGRSFQQRTGRPVVLSFGSTGLLAKQIRDGAPFDVFAAANASFVDDVVAAGACVGSTRTLFAHGRLAVWTKQGSAEGPATLEALAGTRFSRIALAQPDHAPYGQAARAALQSAGIWEAVAPRIVYGENVRQALQFAETGNVEAAIVAVALVAHDADNPWSFVPEHRHPRLEQVLVVCGGGRSRPGGEEFARFVASESGRDVMRRYGLEPP